MITRDTYIGQPPLPPINDAMREAARQTPGEQMIFYDPALADTDNAPGFAIQGGRRIDEEGNLTDEEWINEAYWPSPGYVGFSFDNGFELALWKVFRGFRPAGILVDSLYAANLQLQALDPDDTHIHVTTAPDIGNVVIQAATSEQFVPSQWQHTHVVKGSELLVHFGYRGSPMILDLNPGSQFGGQFRLVDLATLLTSETIEVAHQQGDVDDSSDEPDPS
jgi:hypothetical protein